MLTAELAKRAGRVIAVELDDNLAELLKQTLSWASNLTVVHEDVLKVRLRLCSKRRVFRQGAGIRWWPTCRITSPRRCCAISSKGTCGPMMMVVMVQKEVARAITAAPGEMSLLSVAVQFYGEARIVSSVSAHSFFPAPKVDSAILKIRLHPQPLHRCRQNR